MKTKKQHPLVAACRRFLPSLVRLTLPAGIDCKDFITLIKEAYVDVATLEHGRAGKLASISAVARLTGLTRVDVRSIRAREVGEDRTMRTDDHLARLSNLLRDWHCDALLTDDSGRPLELPVTGTGSTFESLARRHFVGVDVTALLKELKTAKAVQTTHRGTARVMTEFILPERRSADYAQRLGSLVEDFLQTLAYNLNRPDEAPSLIEARTTDRVPFDCAAEFRTMLETEVEGVCHRVDKWLQQKMDKASPATPTARLGFGVYQIGGDPRPTKLTRVQPDEQETRR